jgi:hypothetical protein
MTYGLTIIFFSYMLEKQLSSVFYPRLIANVLLGIIVTHLFRKALLAFSLHPPMPTFKWGQLLFLLLTFASAYSFLTSYAVEILKLYDASRKVSLERRFLISLVIDTPIIFVWVSIYILWHYIEFTNSEAIQKVKLESLIKELQLKTIKSQMNPHFIFNALNSIRALVDEDPQRARQAITELSNILRSSIQADQSEVASLEKELNIVLEKNDTNSAAAVKWLGAENVGNESISPDRFIKIGQNTQLDDKSIIDLKPVKKQNIKSCFYLLMSVSFATKVTKYLQS